MSATAVYEEHIQIRRERRPCSRPGMTTLGEVLARAHEQAHARGAAACPACDGQMAPRGDSAQCAYCGTRLS